MIPGLLPAMNQPQPSKRGISRRTVLVGLTSLGLAATGGGITWLVLSGRPQLTSPSLSRTAVPSPTTSPRATPSGPPLGTTLYTYRGHSRISTGASSVHAVAWSPDGKYILSGAGNYNVNPLNPYPIMGQ